MKRIVALIVGLVLLGSTVSFAMAEESGAYIKVGDYNEQVIALHRKLRELGCLSIREESPWGPNSVAAVKSVQYVTGQAETGEVNSSADYEAIMAIDEALPQFAIRNIKEIDSYLDYVKAQGLTAFISVRDEAANELKVSTKEKLRALGLTTDWTDRYRKAYIAVIENGSAVDEIAAEEKTGPALSAEGTAGGIRYVVVSAGYENDGGSNSSIVLNDQEYSRNRRGFNLVVIKENKIIDSVSFDTCGEENPIGRR